MHTGSHKLNNALGQALIAKRLGKHRIIAETGAGQHGVATATVCARFGLDCIVYMGAEDIRRQAPERRADEAPRRRGAPGRVRHPHAQGGDERGDPRLDRERRDDVLPDRVVRRPRAVPGDRAGAAARDRAGGTGAVPRRRGPPAGGRDRLRRRRLERDRHVLRLPPRRGRAPDRRRGCRVRRRWEAAAQASSTAPARRSSPTRTDRSSTPIRSPRGSTTPASGPSTRTCATPAAPST